MSTRQPLRREGLRFKKLDLHLHTPAPKCFDNSGVTADAIVKTALAKELTGIAVTDHNSGAWIDKIKDAASTSTFAGWRGTSRL